MDQSPARGTFDDAPILSRRSRRRKRGAKFWILAFIPTSWCSGALDFAAQGAADEFSEAQLFAPRFRHETLLDRSGKTECHRDTVLERSCSGHEPICIIVSYTLSRPEFSCRFLLTQTRSAACGIRNPRPSRSLFLLPSTERFKRWPIKSIAATNPPRSARCFTRRRACRPTFA